MWEQLEDYSRFISHRLKVPGGWIVRTVVIAIAAHEGGAPNCVVEQTFIRDPGHKWELEKKERITTETIPLSDDKGKVKVKRLTTANRSTCSPEEIEVIRQIINDVRGT